jgi:hypothetical protein
MSHLRQRVEEVHVPCSCTSRFSNPCNSDAHTFNAEDETSFKFLSESTDQIVLERELETEVAR